MLTFNVGIEYRQSHFVVDVTAWSSSSRGTKWHEICHPYELSKLSLNLKLMCHYKLKTDLLLFSLQYACCYSSHNVLAVFHLTMCLLLFISQCAGCCSSYNVLAVIHLTMCLLLFSLQCFLLFSSKCLLLFRWKCLLLFSPLYFAVTVFCIKYITKVLFILILV